jgi:hypothetical protein
MELVEAVAEFGVGPVEAVAAMMTEDPRRLAPAGRRRLSS